ncbi:MAG: hypothetical protein U5K71_09905 [Gracilimonas sp.]|nr:hypothetical protein [Gracilimonas sp.]
MKRDVIQAVPSLPRQLKLETQKFGNSSLHHLITSSLKTDKKEKSSAMHLPFIMLSIIFINGFLVYININLCTAKERLVIITIKVHVKFFGMTQMI